MPFWQIEYLKIGIVEISTWSFLTALALAVGLFLYFLALQKNKIKISEFNFLLKALGCVLAIFLGARLFNFLEGDWLVKNFWHWQLGGFSFWGGLMGGLLCGFVIWRFSALKNYPFLKLFNLAAIPLTVALLIGRSGCLLAQDHPGILTSLPWGIVWPNGEIRHPVVVYLLLSHLGLLAFLLLLKKLKAKTSCWSGLQKSPMAVFLLWVGVSRFLLDFTRIRNEIFSEKMLAFLSWSQWMGILAIFVGFWLLWRAKPMSLIKTNNNLKQDH
ncbi:MAG: hypothetical protein COU85_01375 [Candidatus Portnoybacteria bacterium CG10_big_fil_rev_8_21_14_0_10_44_7]|uniref:Phosphatidylglycerol--prolipoprotein diacylglyceryl transferase n=1 Tax=Candidatus Portnoybacteria bacterium CG10_big_fil_rev_8_21_14_0_10_44_7 TaxID=1974816 RepID=A0A2M8KIY6_9BACT|nr:MAG: hypothetical protein COU85_01375 [Candidatus Portnoybacteria bacterium CG10_big_fil_rev_8_21_14_0_10_44_7]